MDGGAVRALLSTLCCQRGKRLLELEAPALSWIYKILMGVFYANISSYSIKYGPTDTGFFGADDDLDIRK